jgi:hypothetical protein
MFNGYKSLNVMNLNVLTDNEDRTVRRSSPLGDRFGTFEARFIGFHLGYSCQSFRLFTPAHIFSVGVPSNLSDKNVIQFSSICY